jgi:hypothetical protein
MNWQKEFYGGSGTLLVPILLFLKFYDYERAGYWLTERKLFAEKYEALKMLEECSEIEKIMEQGPEVCMKYIAQCEEYSIRELKLENVFNA